MKRHTKSAGKILDQFFARVPKASAEQVNASRERVMRQLNMESAEATGNLVELMRPARRRSRVLAAAMTPVLAAAAVLFAIVGSVVLIKTLPTVVDTAMAQAVDGTLYRKSGGESHLVKAGEKIESGALIHSDGGHGAVLELTDGSRVEMRSESELLLERADDGVQIRLTNGGVIVNAAKQHTGHLYVQTKDVKVSVVGTVFLVNAEEEGSRVAVIEGEVHVQQGATEKKLLPGEQVATNPVMEAHAVSEEISWSRNAEAHLALLEQAAPPAAAQGAPEKFEEVVIRQPLPPAQGGRGGGGGDAPIARPMTACLSPGLLRITPGRFIATRASLLGLIAVAYGNNCAIADVLSGAPEWAQSASYDVEALIPTGAPFYSRQELLGGSAPGLQKMLQNMLADRFKLTVRREMKEMPVYNLVLIKEGKLQLSPDQNPDTPGAKPAPALVLTTYGPKGSMAQFAKQAQLTMGRPVIDKTGLKALYDVRLEYGEAPPLSPTESNLPDAERARLTLDRMRSHIAEQFPSAIQEQLGLKLEPARALVEVIVIERVEKPSEN